MRKVTIVSIMVTFVIALAALPAGAYWNLSMPYKMHFPQLPDTTPSGWDVNCTFNSAECCTVVLADDFLCTETGWVKDIHFWGSWMNDVEGMITHFRLEIYSDEPGPPSKPKQRLWWLDVPYDSVHVVPHDMQTLVEGWYCPCCGIAPRNNHRWYYQYNVTIPKGPQFCQEEGTVYWLSIRAYVGTGPQACWGWKTALRQYHYRDDAVFLCPGGTWQELKDPYDYQTLDLAFVITGDNIPPEKVPSLSQLGLIVLALLLAATGAVFMIRRSVRARAA